MMYFYLVTDSKFGAYFEASSIIAIQLETAIKDT